MAIILKQNDIAELVATYRETGSVKRTAKIMGISVYRVRRTLIAAGIRSEYAEEIADDVACGLTVAEIAQKRGVSVKAVQAHLPYIKCAYCVEPRSYNAQNIAKNRAAKKSKSESGEGEG